MRYRWCGRETVLFATNLLRRRTCIMSDNSAPDEKKPWMSSNWGLFRHCPDRYPIDVFSYTREATHCFHERRFLACIAMASTAVEIILNRDRRLRALPNFKSSDGWAYLSNRTLRIARDNGLPSNALLSSGEDLGSQKPIVFVEIRNKVAHGDVAHFVSDLSDYDPGADRGRASIKDAYVCQRMVQHGSRCSGRAHPQQSLA